MIYAKKYLITLGESEFHAYELTNDEPNSRQDRNKKSEKPAAR